MKYLLQCSATDPGFIPSKKLLKNLDIEEDLESGQAVDPEKLYYVEYESRCQLEEKQIGIKDPAQKFYDLKKYKSQPTKLGQDGKVEGLFEKSNKHLKLSYCKTCEILRPPRAFHCATCEACVEVHDHHCPWVGTCIGLRNSHLFIGFLVSTAAHAGLTFLTSAFTAALGPAPRGLIKATGSLPHIRYDINWNLNTFVTIYSATFLFLLGIFSLIQLFGMADQNLTTNEDLRIRWNGNPKNQKAVEIYREKTNFITRLYFYLFVREHESHLTNIMKNKKDELITGDTDTAAEESPFLESKGKPISNIGILKERYGVDIFESGQK